jgi:FkbM family methyltransferase
MGLASKGLPAVVPIGYRSPGAAVPAVLPCRFSVPFPGELRVEALSTLFSGASRMLRRTPLRRLRWVNELHGALFSRLHARGDIRLGELTVEIDPRDRTMRKKLVLYGSYEPYLASVLAAAARKDTAVIDVGANFGLHALPLAARVGPFGRVFAFEPDPDNFAILTRNAARNGLRNVTAHRCALADRAGTAQLFQSRDNRGNLSLFAANVEGRESGDGTAVPLATGDDMLRELDLPVSLVKLDVEGAEPAVLRGLAGVLERNPEAVLVFEFCPVFVAQGGEDPLAFLLSLESAGYRLEWIDEAAGVTAPQGAAALVARARDCGEPINVRAVRRARAG